jgi:broad specificity phosphatase PhoE
MARAGPTIYLIRHGEKGAKLPDGKDPDGLDAQGEIRAKGLPNVFSASSEYNVRYILAEHPKSRRSIVTANAGRR